MADSISTKKATIAKEYFRRSGSLLLNATGSYFTEAMPNTTDTVAGISSAFNDVQRSTAGILNNALKKRAQLNTQSPIKAINSWFLNKSNEYDDFSDSFSSFDVDTDDAGIAKSAINAEERSADQISKTVVETTHKMVDAQITATANILTGIDKLAATNASGFDNVNRRLDKLIEVVTKNTATLIDATVAGKSTGNNDVAKMIQSGKFDFNTYKKHVKSFGNSQEASLFGSMFSMLSSMHKSGTITPELVSSIAFGGLVDKLAPSLKKNMKTIDTIINNTIMESLMRLGEKNFKSPLMNMFGKIFGIDRNARSTPNNRATVKNAAFDNITRNAIVDVIPTYLREILVQLGGDNLLYNHKNGKFSRINRNRHDVHFSRTQETNGSYGSISRNGVIRGKGLQGVDYSNAALYEIYRVLSTGINVYNVGTEEAHVQNSRFKHAGLQKPGIRIGESGKIDQGSKRNAGSNRDRTTLYDIFSGKADRDNILTKDLKDENGNPISSGQRAGKWVKSKGSTLLSSLFSGSPEDFLEAFQDVTMDLGDAFMKSNMVSNMRKSLSNKKEETLTKGREYFSQFKEFFRFEGDPESAKKRDIVFKSIGVVGGGILAGPLGMLGGGILASAIDFTDPKKGLGQNIKDYLFGKNYDDKDGKRKHQFGLLEKLTNPIKYQIGKTVDMLKGQLKHNFLDPIKDIGFAIKDRITNAAGSAAGKLFGGLFKAGGWVAKKFMQLLGVAKIGFPSSVAGGVARGGLALGGGLLGGTLRTASRMLYVTDKAKEAAQQRRVASKQEYNSIFGKYELDEDGNIKRDDRGRPIKLSRKDNNYKYKSYKSYLESESERLAQRQDERDRKREGREETQAKNIQTITDKLTGKIKSDDVDRSTSEAILTSASALASADGSVSGGEATDLSNIANESMKDNPNEGRVLSLFHKVTNRVNGIRNKVFGNSEDEKEEPSFFEKILDGITGFFDNPLLIAGAVAGLAALFSDGKITDTLADLLGGAVETTVDAAGETAKNMLDPKSDVRSVYDNVTNVADTLVQGVATHLPGFEGADVDTHELLTDFLHIKRLPRYFSKTAASVRESIKLSKEAAEAGMSVKDYITSKSFSTKFKNTAANISKKTSSYISEITNRLNGIDVNAGLDDALGSKPVKNIWDAAGRKIKSSVDDLAIWGISVGQKLASKWDNAVAASRSKLTMIGSKLDDLVKGLAKTKIGKSVSEFASASISKVSTSKALVEFFSNLRAIKPGTSLEKIFRSAGKIFTKGASGILGVLKFIVTNCGWVLDFVLDGIINMARSDEIFDKDPKLVTGVNQVSAFTGGMLAGSGDGIFDDFDPSDLLDILFNAIKWAGLGAFIFGASATVVVPIVGTVAGGVVGAIIGAIVGAIIAMIGGDQITRAINAVIEKLCELLGIPTEDDGTAGATKRYNPYDAIRENNAKKESNTTTTKYNPYDAIRASKSSTSSTKVSSEQLLKSATPTFGNGYGYTSIQSNYSDPRMKNGGCGPIAASRYFSKSGKNISPNAFANAFDNGGFRNAKGGTHISAFSDLGMDVTANPFAIMNQIKNGEEVILQGKGGAPFTNSGHYVVAEGLSGDRVQIYDPLKGESSASWSSLQNNLQYGASGGFGYGGTNGTNYQNFPLYHQGGDAPWKDLSYGSNTIGASACGPTSMAMVLSAATGQSITPDKTSKWSVDNGYRQEGVGTSWGFFPALGSQYGLTTEEGGTNLQFLDKSLSEGEPVILSGRGGKPFTSGGHFVVAVGKDKDGNYLINDPAGHSGAYSADALSGLRNSWSFNKNGSGFLNSKYVPTYDASSYTSTDGTAALSGDALMATASTSSDTEEETSSSGFLGQLFTVFGNIGKGLRQWFTGTGTPTTYAEVAGETMDQTLGISSASSAVTALSNSAVAASNNTASPAAINYSGNIDQLIWTFFKNKGLADHQIAGILGNIYAESGLNPGINEKNPLVAGSRGGYGLCQWTGGRRVNLENYAASTGKQVNDPVMQCEFLWIELNGSEIAALNALKISTTVYDASTAFLTKFERPANQGDAVRNKRASYAQTFYDRFHKDPTTSSAGISDLNYQNRVADDVGSGYGYGGDNTSSGRASAMMKNRALIKKYRNSSTYAQGGFGSGDLKINHNIINTTTPDYDTNDVNPMMIGTTDPQVSTVKLETLLSAAVSELRSINRNTMKSAQTGYGYGEDSATQKTSLKTPVKRNAKFAIPSTANYSSASSVLAIAKGY